MKGVGLIAVVGTVQREVWQTRRWIGERKNHARRHTARGDLEFGPHDFLNRPTAEQTHRARRGSVRAWGNHERSTIGGQDFGCSGGLHQVVQDLFGQIEGQNHGQAPCDWWRH